MAEPLNSVLSSILNSIEHPAPGAATPTISTPSESAPAAEPSPPPSSTVPTFSTILPPVSSSEPTAPTTTSVITPSPVGSSDGSSPANTVTTLFSSQEFSSLSTFNGGGSEPTSIEGADNSTSSQSPQYTLPVSSSATIPESGGETSQLLTPGPLPASPTAASLSSGLGISDSSSTSVMSQSEHQPGQSKGSSSPKWLVGTVVGSVVGTGMMIVVVVLLFKWRRRRRRRGERFSSASNRASCSTLSTWMDQSDFGDLVPAGALLRDAPERFTTTSSESNSTLRPLRSIPEKWRTEPTGFHVSIAEPVPAAMKECTTTRWQGPPLTYSRDHMMF